jgi:hypothetical protein
MQWTAIKVKRHIWIEDDVIAELANLLYASTVLETLDLSCARKPERMRDRSSGMREYIAREACATRACPPAARHQLHPRSRTAPSSVSRGTKLTDEDVTALAEPLRTNRFLKHLNVAYVPTCMPTAACRPECALCSCVQPR